MALKGGHQMPHKNLRKQCIQIVGFRLEVASDVTVTCIEGEQRGGAYAKLFADGSALRR
jgi:hypothetical protein